MYENELARHHFHSQENEIKGMSEFHIFPRVMY